MDQRPPAPQDDDPFQPSARRVRARTLILLRWLAVAGQTTTVLGVYFVLGFATPLAPALALIAASAWVNIWFMVVQPGQRILTDREAAVQLAFDVIQLSALIGVTGGLANPFIVLVGAPIVIAFTALRARYAIALAILALLATSLTAVWNLPLPWAPAGGFRPPGLYVAGLWTALVTGAGFMSVFTWRLASDARRMSTALSATQSVLAREQRLSALGGLAAAAAHELGTPLGTIHMTAKEMVRAAPEGELKEDAALIFAQSQRCREILQQLSRRGDAGDLVHAQLRLSQLLEEVVEPLKNLGPRIEVTLEPPGGADARPPPLKRMPEVHYAIANYVENALDYAVRRIDVVGRWTDQWVEVEVRDDGPGFAPDVLSKLGEPYVTRRAPDQAHGGLGLGFFIAKTFVERTGGEVSFGNARPPASGAVVRARWPMARVAGGAGSF